MLGHTEEASGDDKTDAAGWGVAAFFDFLFFLLPPSLLLLLFLFEPFLELA